MKKDLAEYTSKLFEDFVNAHITERYEFETRPAYYGNESDFHFYIKVRTIIWDKEWHLIAGFAQIAHLCFRYNVDEKEFELW